MGIYKMEHISMLKYLSIFIDLLQFDLLSVILPPFCQGRMESILQMARIKPSFIPWCAPDRSIPVSTILKM